MLRATFIALIGLCLTLASAPARADAPPVVVFAAASLKTALDQIVTAYQAETGGRVVVSYAGSSGLARQIQYGAPADVFVSANVTWMDLLQDQGLISRPSRVDLVSNALVLIAPADTPREITIEPGFDLAGLLGQDRLAVALVDAVPAGLYAQTALRNLGVWDDIAPRLAQSDSVRGALRLVATGQAPLGIVYATDARADARVQILGRFPTDSHPPIVYPAALTISAAPAAAAFLNHLTAPSARAILDEHGFSRPGA